MPDGEISVREATAGDAAAQQTYTWLGMAKSHYDMYEVELGPTLPAPHCRLRTPWPGASGR